MERWLSSNLLHSQVQSSQEMTTPTTQNAPLERLLARQRCKHVQPHVKGKRVLDFGCGVNAWNAIEIQHICTHVDGVDRSLPSTLTTNGINLYKEIDEIIGSTYDVIIALAVFEHIKPLQLRDILTNLVNLTHAESSIIGTVPSPRSRRVLEFLSYRLGMIDRSQIEDHKVYYDDLWLREITEGTGWRLHQYKRFQLGMNGFFWLRRAY
jgi:hypothetical protein